MAADVQASAEPSVKNVSAENSSTCAMASWKSPIPVRSLRNVHRRSPRLLYCLREPWMSTIREMLRR